MASACRQNQSDSAERSVAATPPRAPAVDTAMAQPGDGAAPSDSASRHPSSPAISLTPPVQDTTFAGTTDPIHRERVGPPVATLRAVRAAEHSRYDRVVFEFSDGPLPGYHIEYTDRALQQCGSGDEVSPASAVRLLVRLQPAQAHDDRGSATIAERQRTLTLPNLKELRIICDFEGRVEWLVGLAVRAPYQLRELAEPTRLVLDVGHEP